MTVVAILYALLLALSGLSCVHDARRGRRPVAMAILDMTTAACWAVLVVAFAMPVMAAALGRWAIVLYVFGLGWTVLSTPYEVRRFRAEPRPPGPAGTATTALAVAMVGLLVVPALVIGSAVAFRAL